MTTQIPTPAIMLQSVGLQTSLLNPDPYVQLTSIMSLDSQYTKNLEAFDAVAKSHGENVLAKLQLRELQRDAEWVLVLTDKALYKFDVYAPLNAPRKRKDLLDFYDVEADSSNPLQFSTKLYKSNMKTAVKSSFMRFIGSLGSKMDITTLFQRREYICLSEMQRDQFVFVMNRAIRNCWQRMLEDTVIPEPEYYQLHQLVIKINRKGAHQERLLVLSNAWLYNVEISHNPSKVEEVKWCVPINCLEAVSIDQANTEANFFFDNDYLRDFVATMKANGVKKSDVISKSNDTYNFDFTDETSRLKFVTVIRYLYKQNCGRNLNVIAQNDGGSIDRVYTESAIGNTAPPAPTPVPEGLEVIMGSDMGGLTMDGDSMPVVNVARDTEDKSLLVEPLEKLIKDGSNSHIKYFALYPDLSIKWGDSPHKFKHSAKIISLMKSTDVIETIPPEKRAKFFALRTTQKPLFLIAESVSSRATWMTIVESLLAPGAATTTTRAKDGISSLESTVPVIKGPMVKYIKGGRDKHVKFFCVYSDGTIKWGDTENNLKHKAQVTDIDQDITQLEGVIARQDAVRFIRIKTSDKTLDMLCPNQDSADRWVSVVSKILNPDLQDDEEDDDE